MAEMPLVIVDGPAAESSHEAIIYMMVDDEPRNLMVIRACCGFCALNAYMYQTLLEFDAFEKAQGRQHEPEVLFHTAAHLAESVRTGQVFPAGGLVRELESRGVQVALATVLPQDEIPDYSGIGGPH